MTHELLVHLATWNVADQGPPPVGRLQLNKLIQLDSPSPADICAIGLQEVRRSSDWGSQLAKEVAKSDYVLVRSIQMQGIILYTYVLRKHLPFVTNVETQYTRTALNGLLGSKGAVSFRADLYGVNVAIVNCHLCAYDEKFSERIENYNVIIEGQTFKDKYVENILDHDYVFWMGDLNFRLDDLTRDEVIERTEKEDYQTLLVSDQLSKARKEELIFVDFDEGTIRFPPTYKFDIGSNLYDSGPKCRKPAWCDRILYMVHEDAFMELSTLQLLTANGRIDPRLHAQQLVYTSIMDFQASDHKPVVSQFTIKAFNVVPAVVFEDPQCWQCGNEATVKYRVIGMPTSTWDYLALYKADFFTLDEYVTYVYATGKNEGTAGASVAIHTAKFPASTMRDPGTYRLCYISAGKKFVRGMSNIFEVQPKYVLAPLPPVAEEVPKAVAVDQQQSPSVDAATGTDAAEVFADASAATAVQEFPARAPPDGALPFDATAADESDGPQLQAGTRAAAAVPTAGCKEAAAGGSGSRLHPGMSIQELKLLSAELRQEQRRKQSATSLLLAKASKLSARLAGPPPLPAVGEEAPLIVEEECAAGSLPLPPSASPQSALPAASAAGATAPGSVVSSGAAVSRPAAMAESSTALDNPAMAMAAAVAEEPLACREAAAEGGFGHTAATSVMHSSDTASYVTALGVDSLTAALSTRWPAAADGSQASVIAGDVALTTSAAGAAAVAVVATADAHADGRTNWCCLDSTAAATREAATAGASDDSRGHAAEGVAGARSVAVGLPGSAVAAAGSDPVCTSTGSPGAHDAGPAAAVAGAAAAELLLGSNAERADAEREARMHCTLSPPPPAAAAAAGAAAGGLGEQAVSAAAPWHSQWSAGMLSLVGSHESGSDASSRASSVSPPAPPPTTAERPSENSGPPPKSNGVSSSPLPTGCADADRKAK